MWERSWLGRAGPVLKRRWWPRSAEKPSPSRSFSQRRGSVWRQSEEERLEKMIALKEEATSQEDLRGFLFDFIFCLWPSFETFSLAGSTSLVQDSFECESLERGSCVTPAKILGCPACGRAGGYRTWQAGARGSCSDKAGANMKLKPP